MKVIIDADNEITRIISNSAIPQELRDGEFELEIKDPKIIEAFNKGQEILYEPIFKKVQAIPEVKEEPEKVALYEAMAGLFEEVQALKQIPGGDA